ncbi:MAG: sigma-70 family RNA polymerase sigma factor [Oscillospiraceae bacterium]|nr:sigma-70 family RNA polymerase sigma factor [Oscillospiraceae bacterium]
MIETALYLLMHSLFLFLRIAPGGSFPRPLSREEEKACLDRWAAGDLEARNTLIEHNLRLVSHILKKYYAQADDMEDLLSIGTIGLIKGVDSYRADRGVRLSSYCSRCVENEVLMYFRSRRKNQGDVSLSDALEGDEDGGLSILDVLADEDDMAERIGDRELCAQLRGLIREQLEEREAQVIRLRYGLAGREALTQKQTAERIGVSRSYVSRIEKRALEKLRQALEGDGGKRLTDFTPR